MDVFTILFIAWVLTQWVTGDAPYALRGKMPPKHLERMERLRRGESVPLRYGLGDYLHDLWAMALKADVERRQRKAAKKREVPNSDVPAPATVGGGQEKAPASAVVPDPTSGPAAPTGPSTRPDRPDPTGADRHPGHRKPAPEPQPSDLNGDRPKPAMPPADVTPAASTDTTQPVRSATEADRSGPSVLAPVIPFPTPQGDQMSNSNPSGVTEVTGLSSAVAYAEGVAKTHAEHGGAEGFVSSLGTFECGPATIAKVMEAREASINAAAKWGAAAAALKENNEAVREAYAASGGEAGNKSFATSE